MADGYDVRVLICSECGEEFIFTPEAQQYFAERGYTEDPKRCKTCHTQHKRKQRGVSQSEERTAGARARFSD